MLNLEIDDRGAQAESTQKAEPYKKGHRLAFRVRAPGPRTETCTPTRTPEVDQLAAPYWNAGPLRVTPKNSAAGRGTHGSGRP